MTAERPDVVVVGAGIAGLVAARDLAGRGARVTVLEAAATPGGCVAAHTVAGLRLDSGAEAFATRGGVVRSLVDQLGLGSAVVTPAVSGAWVHLPDGAVPLPPDGVLGIPADLRAPEVRRAVGRMGVVRASLDRVLPARIGLPPGPTTVADLVRARMGRRVLRRLVAPVVTGVYSARPELADLDTVLPGIRDLIRSSGSLSAAVTRQRTGAPAGSAVAGLEGGMVRLVEALVADLAGRGVTVRTGTAVEALQTDDGGWRLVLVGGGSLSAATVVLAVPGPVGEHLLEPHLSEALALGGPTPDVLLATLVVDAPVLDAAPRGTGVLVARGTPGVRAKALTHRTAKWAWLAKAAGPGRHVLRLSYDRLAEADEARLREIAVRDAGTLLGVPLTESQVVGFARVRWAGAIPPARAGRRDEVVRLRTALEALPGLHATGAWLAGTGLAAVVGDARALAANLPLADRPAGV